MIGTVVLIAVAASVGYFGNVELQSYWGRQAVNATGLRILRLDEAIDQARAENKLVLVDVSAIWCGTCRRLDNEVFANDEVKEVLKKRYVFSRLEYESGEGQKFIKERNVRGFPNLWVLDGNGNKVKRLHVTFDPAKFAEQLP